MRQSRPSYGAASRAASIASGGRTGLARSSTICSNVTVSFALKSFTSLNSARIFSWGDLVYENAAATPTRPPFDEGFALRAVRELGVLLGLFARPIFV